MKSVLVISERDNVATALEALEPGRGLEVQGSTITVRDAIPRGHKVALVSIEVGAAVIKYGSPIGLASADIRAGAHVHTHNLSSSRGRGDLEAREAGGRELGSSADRDLGHNAGPGDQQTSGPPSPGAAEFRAPEPRIAEPPDDRDGAVTERATR